MLCFKASRELQSFQNSELEVCFFQIERAPKTSSGLPFSTLSRLNVRYRPKKGLKPLKPIMEDNLKCHIKGLEAYRFATNGMKALAHVLQSEGEKVGFHDDVYDWARILFHPEIRGLGATIEALNQLATKMNAPFVFKATASLPDSNRFFHSWFQSTHNVRVGMVEGGHRCETAMRIFYGYGIGQTVPLQHLDSFRQIDANSTLVQPFSIKVIQTDKTYHLITEALIDRLKKYSSSVQKSRDQVVRSTYKQLWMDIYEDCSNITLLPKYKKFQEMTIDKFIDEVFHKTPVEDDLTSFVEDIKMAVINKYWQDEPGRTEVENIDKQGFMERLHTPKMQGRNFMGVREVSEKKCQKNLCYAIPSCHLFYDSNSITKVCRNSKCFKA
jgi:hypothetical protein